MNTLYAVIVTWLNASRKIQVGDGLNRSAGGRGGAVSNALSGTMGWILCCVITVTVTKICLCSVPSVVKIYGAHLKASAAMVRLRLYAVLALLPPNTYEGMSWLTRCSRLASTGQYWYNSWLCTGMWKVGLHNQLTGNE